MASSKKALTVMDVTPIIKFDLIDDSVSAQSKGFDTQVDAEGIIVSGSDDFSDIIYKIISSRNIKLNINILHRFRNAKSTLHELIHWDDALRAQPIPSKSSKSDRTQTVQKRGEFPKNLIVFFKNSLSLDMMGQEFIQVLHRTGLSRKCNFYFILFVDCPTTREFREMMSAIGINFVYDTDSSIDNLVQYLEILRTTYLVRETGYSLTQQSTSDGYGPYCGLALKKLDGKKLHYPMGTVREPIEIEKARDVKSLSEMLFNSSD